MPFSELPLRQDARVDPQGEMEVDVDCWQLLTHLESLRNLFRVIWQDKFNLCVLWRRYNGLGLGVLQVHALSVLAIRGSCGPGDRASVENR